jgi:ATP-dependent DNA ligase
MRDVVTTMKAMTFEEVTQIHVDRFLDDDRYALEPKYDGVRTLISVTSEGVKLLNRNGNPLAAASTNAHRAPLAREFEAMGLKGEWMFDGELLDDGVLIVFDLPKACNDKGCVFTTASTTYEDRRVVLERLAELVDWGTPGSRIRLATQALGVHKRALYEAIAETGGEGVMVKRLDSRYEQRRTKSAGHKIKFTCTVDAVITAMNIEGKDNAALGLIDGERIVPVGRCSLIGKPPVRIGSVVEVRYLYVGANGRLVQPRLIRVRGDKTAAECVVDQLVGTEVKKWSA